MSLKLIHEQLEIIKNTSSTKEKENLLRKYLKDETFRKVIKLAYDESLYYKVNQLSKMHSPQGLLIRKPSNEELFNFLEKLAHQRGATGEDKQKLTRLASMDKETYEVVKKIVNKDLKAGIGKKTVNKAYPNLIFIMPYMRCSTAANKEHTFDYEEGIIAQEKADGAFVNILINNIFEKFLTRNGNQIYQLEHLSDLFAKIDNKFKHTVYMGELLVVKNGKILSRKEGNGIINSCVQGTADKNDSQNIIIKLWDAVPYNDFFKGICNIHYSKRLSRVNSFVKSTGNSSIYQIETKMVRSKKEADAFYKKMRAEGKEGVICKKKDMIWKNHTSPNAIKLKNIVDFDLVIVGWERGKKGTRFENCMGSILCESACGKLRTSAGTGFTDEEREQDWSLNMGKIATITCESIILSKKEGSLYSLYLPRFDILRPDRNNAQTLEDMQKR
jgi:DNA ligase-1